MRMNGHAQMNPEERMETRLSSIEDRLDAIVSALHEIGKALGIKESLERIAEKLAASGRHATEPAPPMEEGDEA